MNLTSFIKVLSQIYNFKCLVCDSDYKIINKEDNYSMNDNWLESVSVAIVNDAAPGKIHFNYYLLVCKSGFEISMMDDLRSLSDIKKVDRIVKHRI